MTGEAGHRHGVPLPGEVFGPPEDDTRVAHAMLLRQHPNAEKSAAARRDLEALAQNPKFALTLNRAFFNEALAAKDFAAAKRYAALVTSDRKRRSASGASPD